MALATLGSMTLNYLTEQLQFPYKKDLAYKQEQCQSSSVLVPAHVFLPVVVCFTQKVHSSITISLAFESSHG